MYIQIKIFTQNKHLKKYETAKKKPGENKTNKIQMYEQ